jgi:hypothetical protein
LIAIETVAATVPVGLAEVQVRVPVAELEDSCWLAAAIAMKLPAT